MEGLATSPIVRHFSVLEDHRVDRQKKHLLIDIITIAICATLAGFNTYEGFEEFGEIRRDWLASFLKLPNGIPSHDTFNRVFARIKPGKFIECFLAWMEDVVSLCAGDVVAIDGKTLRRSFDTAASKSPIHVITAFATANGLSLAQVKVNEKSNEITAIPTLLDMLALKGCIVTMDAMGCQRDICAQIVEQGADYCITLKGNQPKLAQAVQDHLMGLAATKSDQAPKGTSFYTEKEIGHGREVVRRYVTSNNIAALQSIFDWPGLTSVGLVKSTRIINGEATYEDRFYLTSLPGDAKQFAHAVRSHWLIENDLHWRLDVIMGEDDCRVRKDHGAENLAAVRRAALNLLKRDPVKKSIPKKQMRCAMDTNYLAKTLTGQHI